MTRGVSRVLAIYEASSAGAEVLRRAQALVTEHNARLTIAAHVVPAPAGCCGMSSTRWNTIMREEATAELMRARDLLEGITADLALIEGAGADAIADEAERRQCDLILIPARKRPQWHDETRRVSARTTAAVLAVRGARRPSGT